MIYAGYVKVAPGKPHVKPRTERVKLRGHKFSLGKGKKLLQRCVLLQVNMPGVDATLWTTPRDDG